MAGLRLPEATAEDIGTAPCPRAPNPDVAKSQIRSVMEQGGGKPVPVKRGDGKKDTVLNLIKTPDGLDDVYISESFIDHIIADKHDHREQFVHYILPSLQDPAEVWLAAVKFNFKGREKMEYRRYFLTAFSDINTVTVVEKIALNDKDAWLLWTFFTRERINSMRRGILLHHRKDK